MGEILEIRMQTPGYGMGETCPVCGEPASGFHGLPMFNGDVMSNDWSGDWVGVPCCEQCYEKHLRGEVETFDADYRHMLGDRGWIDGGGI